MKQIVILAGGKGTRLKSILNDLPKPLAKVGGLPLLGHHLYLARRYNFDEALLLVGYGSEQIEEWVSKNPISGLKITCIADGIPRGTAGAVLSVYDRLSPEFLVSYADTILNVNLDLFYQAHLSQKNNGATLFLHPNDHPFDSDLVEIDNDKRILKFHSYPHPQEAWLPNLVNAALYYINRNALGSWRQSEKPMDFAKDLFPEMLRKNLLLQGYVSPEYIKDAGTPERLNKVRSAWEQGVVSRASLQNKQRAVFIDRDGTLNKDVGHLTCIEDLEVFPFVGPALRRLNDNEWRAIIITNQPVLARGDIDEAGLRKIHARLDSEVAKVGAFFDGLFLCPHHPDSGFSDELSHLKIVCECRKPAPGLILSAQKSMNIDLSHSWFIGDSTRDLGAAEAAKVSSILVSTGSAGLDEVYPYEPLFTAKDFSSAVDFIIDIYPQIVAQISPIIENIGVCEDWFVGGLTRSGKTTIAATLMRELRSRDQEVVVINLDRWLLSEKDRRDGVFGRYEFDAIKKTFAQAQSRHIEEVRLSLPVYSRRRRERFKSCYHLVIPANAILIWEGVVALALAEDLGLMHRSIFVESSENQRRERFFHYDIVRGKRLEQSEETWLMRNIDENPIVLKDVKAVRYHLNLDNSFDCKN